MTQVISTQGYGAAFDLREFISWHTTGDQGAWVGQSQRLLTARAHKFGCFVIEDDGRFVEVRPKWLLGLLRDLKAAAFMVWMRALHNMTYAGIGIRPRTAAQRRRRPHMKTGRVLVSRRQVRAWQSFIEKAEETVDG